MTRLILWSLALALSGALWLVILKFGWWAVFALAYLYLLLVAAVTSVGGINAALLWLERRRRG